jgi:parvulin-like peptidyl-prolyl isomerase
MTQAIEPESFTLPYIPPATDADIVAYLRRSHKIADVAALAEQDALILKLCEQLGITVSDAEWQTAGDAFRLEHKLLGITETKAWFTQQRIAVEDWSEGIRIALLETKLKEHLFGLVVDNHYIGDRDHYRRVALSQILVSELTEALKIAQALRQEQASFCALALTHSRGKQSQENGGFVGIRFLVELPQGIQDAIVEAKVGEIVGPIHTKLGYHILRVETWLPLELDQSTREQILEVLFQDWLREQRLANSNQ